MKTSGEHSIVCVSNPSLSETNVTWYSSEVDVRVVAVLGAIGANPWTETARAKERRVLANMMIRMIELLFMLWFMFSNDDQLELEVEGWCHFRFLGFNLHVTVVEEVPEL